MSEPADRDARIQSARTALDDHLLRPESARADLEAAGARLRAVTLGFCVLASLAIAAAIHGRLASHPAWPLALLAAVFSSILTVALVLFDLSLVPRGEPSTPDVALRSYLRALATARTGYAWAALAPTARAQTVRVPTTLGEVAVTPGEHAMATPAGVGEYLRGFARSRGAVSRNMLVREVAIADVQDDVARVEAVLVFQSWPRWIGWLTLALFVPFRQIILVGLILYLVMRKRIEVRVQKTLIRGKDGAWYVLDADLLEGASI